MIVSIVILEETLGIEALADDLVVEKTSHFFDQGIIIVGWSGLSIERNGSCVINGHINVFLETFFVENFIDRVTKISPSYFARLINLTVTLKVVADQVEFGST